MVVAGANVAGYPSSLPVHLGFTVFNLMGARLIVIRSQFYLILLFGTSNENKPYCDSLMAIHRTAHEYSNFFL